MGAGKEKEDVPCGQCLGAGVGLSPMMSLSLLMIEILISRKPRPGTSNRGFLPPLTALIRITSEAGVSYGTFSISLWSNFPFFNWKLLGFSALGPLDDFACPSAPFSCGAASNCTLMPPPEWQTRGSRPRLQ
jgi:hypothetical protein